MHLDVDVLDLALVEHLHELFPVGGLALVPHEALQDDRLRPADGNVAGLSGQSASKMLPMIGDPSSWAHQGFFPP